MPISNIQVEVIESTKTSSEFLKNNINKMWDEFLEHCNSIGRKVWNASLYRLENFTEGPESLNLTLSLIEVKEIQMSVRAPNEFQLGDSYRPYNIFVASLIETADHNFLFGRTNPNTLTAGRIDLIGGALSHSENIVRTGSDVFDAAIAEMEEELNIGAPHIEFGHLVSIVRTKNYSIGLIFHVKLNIDAEQSRMLFAERDSDEITELISVDSSALHEFLINSNSYLPALASLTRDLTRVMHS